MALQLIIAALAFGLPALVGFVVARCKPEWGPFAASGLACIPMGVIFLASAFYMRSQVAEAPFWIGALLVWGTVALLCGFGMGMVGHAFGSKGSRQ